MLYRGKFFLFDMNGHTVDFHIFVGADHNILNTADNPGLNEVAPGGIHLDDHIRGLDLKMLVVDDVLTSGATLTTFLLTLKSAVPDCRISVATLAVTKHITPLGK